MPEPHLLDSPRRRPWPGLTPLPAHRVDAPPERVAVAVVGAGPAGLAVASALWHLGVDDVALFDAADRSCGRFFDRVDVLGQRVLRSPYEHHPGVEGYRDCELLDFARLHWGALTPVERREVRMAQAGHRSVVPLDVFEAFCGHVADVHGVAERTWRTVVRSVEPGPDGVRLRTDAGEVGARFVVLCLGEERRAAPEGWHGGYWDEQAPQDGSLVVVGAGLSAAHLLADAIAAGRQAHWVLRGEQERYQCADVNASFFRPEGRARFTGTPWERRLELMARHRRASVMFEFRPLLEAAEADGRLVVHRGADIEGVDHGKVRLAGGQVVAGDHVALALGTTPSIGAGLLPDAVVNAVDGWPDLDPATLSYSRAPRVFAVGAAACMALGPAARNIDGHRVATARVAGAVAAGLGARVGAP
ncbi:NAD(P)-binding protein [Actinokineospora soli]|uniref:NAD(P)-binding protein n=1 Tax=Actinokineospora soli TaxID=1048753 RepID=A0ABW2TR46_9PSEU